MASASEIEAMQRAMAGLRVTVQKRMTAALRVVSERYGGDPRRFRDTAIGVMQKLTREYGRMGGEFAAEWYNALRASEGMRDRYVARAYIGDMDAEVAATVRRAVAELFEDAPDLDKVFSAITERAAKYVSDAGHETIRRNAVRDPRARGWKRVAHGETCDFCLMLTGRGGVYTRSSVRFKSHVKCNCGVAPSWDASEPEVPEIAYQASARTSGMTREERQIHNERIQAWIDENRDALDELRASLATA